MQRNQYQTAGRRALVEFLEANPDRQLTAEEIYRALCECTPIGKSSVYRLLGELADAAVVRKFQSDAHSSCVYQYVGKACDCSDHFHEKCVKCGKIQHLDCHATADFIRHLAAEHGFAVNCGASVLYGVCADCQRKGGEVHA